MLYHWLKQTGRAVGDVVGSMRVDQGRGIGVNESTGAADLTHRQRSQTARTALPDTGEVNRALWAWFEQLRQQDVVPALLTTPSLRQPCQPVLDKKGELLAAPKPIAHPLTRLTQIAWLPACLQIRPVQQDLAWREIIESYLAGSNRRSRQADSGLLPICPVELEPMYYPIRANDGQVYEAKTLQQYSFFQAGGLSQSVMKRPLQSDLPCVLHQPLQRLMMYGYQLAGIQQLPSMWRNTSPLQAVIKLAQPEQFLVVGMLYLGAAGYLLLRIAQCWSVWSVLPKRQQSLFQTCGLAHLFCSNDIEHLQRQCAALQAVSGQYCANYQQMDLAIGQQRHAIFLQMISYCGLLAAVTGLYRCIALIQSYRQGQRWVKHIEQNWQLAKQALAQDRNALAQAKLAAKPLANSSHA